MTLRILGGGRDLQLSFQWMIKILPKRNSEKKESKKEMKKERGEVTKCTLSSPASVSMWQEDKIDVGSNA